MNARKRRQMLQWYMAHGESIPATCAQFGVSRATLYRWLARAAAAPQKPLRAQSRRPHTTHGPAWSREEVVMLCELTMAHPTWGRGRLTTALAAQTARPRSPATVGRMLAKIRARCPLCQGREGRHEPSAHALMRTFADAGILMPLRLAARDPEKAALRRDKAAIVRAAQALTRPRRA
jgi:transposase